MKTILLLAALATTVAAGAQTASTTPDTLRWKKLPTESYRGKQDDIHFISETTGWYGNGAGKIYRTTDAGATWTKTFEKPGTFFRCIHFLDSLTGFAGTVGTEYFPGVTDTIPLYRTRDGGTSWEPVSYTGPYVKGLCAIDAVAEPFVNHGVLDMRYHLYAVGRVGSPANFMVSHDGGQTWASQSMGPWCKMLFDIKMFNRLEGIACAATSADVTEAHALILSTNDGGTTWTKRYESTRPYELTWKASFPSRKVGYVTIQSYNPDSTVTQQRIARTTDGGKTWRELPLVKNAKAREFGVGFVDDRTGWVGTATGGYETRDGGKSWKPVEMGRATNKIRIYRRPNGQPYGYAIGVDVLRLEH